MDNVLLVKVAGGQLRATASTDPDYPGIDVEFIADDDNGEEPSRPRVLMERPQETGELRALIWDDKNNEDYTQEVVFNDADIHITDEEANALDHITEYNHADCWFTLIEGNQVYDSDAGHRISNMEGLLDLRDGLFMDDIKQALNPAEQKALLGLYNRIGHPINQ